MLIVGAVRGAGRWGGLRTVTKGVRRRGEGGEGGGGGGGVGGAVHSLPPPKPTRHSLTRQSGRGIAGARHCWERCHGPNPGQGMAAEWAKNGARNGRGSGPRPDQLRAPGVGADWNLNKFVGRHTSYQTELASTDLHDNTHSAHIYVCYLASSCERCDTQPLESLYEHCDPGFIDIVF